MSIGLLHRGAAYGPSVLAQTALRDAANPRVEPVLSTASNLDPAAISLKIFDENEDKRLNAEDAVISYIHLVDQYSALQATTEKEATANKAVSAYKAALIEHIDSEERTDGNKASDQKSNAGANNRSEGSPFEGEKRTPSLPNKIDITA